MKTRTSLAAALLLIPFVCQSVAAEKTDSKKPGLYERVKRASVEILVDDHLDGSGWFADPKGLIVTVAHAIPKPGRRIEVRSPVAGRLDAEVVAVDRGFDLAILRVKPREGGYPTLSLAKKMPPAGRDVFVFGAPIFRHDVLLRGAMARNDSTFEYLPDQRCYAEIYHVSGVAPHGMSGGPWVDKSGNVVGVQSALMTEKGVPIGVAFISPAEAVRKLLAAGHSAETPSLRIAIEDIWQQQRDFLDRFPPRTEGLVARIVPKDSPVAEAGLKQMDLIVAVDDKKVVLPDDLLRYVRAKKPGDTVTLTILDPDDAETHEVTAPLVKLEADRPAPVEDAENQ